MSSLLQNLDASSTYKYLLCLLYYTQIVSTIASRPITPLVSTLNLGIMVPSSLLIVRSTCPFRKSDAI